MKLYYSPGSCSTCCHIALEEAGLKHEAIQIDWDNATDATVEKISKMNSMGTLPILELDNGKVLNQNLGILTYIASLAPDSKLLPAAGTFEYMEAMNMLSFVAADLHKTVGGLFSVAGFSADPAKQADLRAYMLVNANKTLSVLDEALKGKDFIMGKQFTVVDAYAFIVTGWTKWLDVSLAPYPNVSSFMNRVLERPSVQKVFKMEGLFD